MKTGRDPVPTSMLRLQEPLEYLNVQLACRIIFFFKVIIEIATTTKTSMV